MGITAKHEGDSFVLAVSHKQLGPATTKHQSIRTFLLREIVRTLEIKAAWTSTYLDSVGQMAPLPTVSRLATVALGLRLATTRRLRMHALLARREHRCKGCNGGCRSFEALDDGVDIFHPGQSIQRPLGRGESVRLGRWSAAIFLTKMVQDLLHLEDR